MKLNVKYEYYHINSLLDPVFDKKIESSEAFLYTNYFGLKQDTVLYLSRFYPNLIVDNAQAFFAKPIEGVDTFYSAVNFLEFQMALICTQLRYWILISRFIILLIILTT